MWEKNKINFTIGIRLQSYPIISVGLDWDENVLAPTFLVFYLFIFILAPLILFMVPSLRKMYSIFINKK